MNTSQNTSIMGAALGAALGCVVAWITETALALDVPATVEGALVVIFTALVALLYPANPPA